MTRPSPIPRSNQHPEQGRTSFERGSTLLALSLIFALVAFGTPFKVSAGAVAKYAYNINATGGTVSTTTQNGVTYKIHTFTSSGTFQVTSGIGNVWYLVVGGGGGGGVLGGGGGAGGFRTNGGYTYPVSAGSYTVTVGGGGAGGTSSTDKGDNGEDSVFAAITSLGGGGGASDGGDRQGLNGGSGGGSQGGSPGPSAGGSGTVGQGNNGGGAPNSGAGRGGGGGGASGIGGDASNSGPTSGNGGAGSSSSISGFTIFYAGGGGGGAQGGTAGTGGAGGGANGTNTSSTPSAATANTGGGGAGSGYNSGYVTAGAGGSGVVIIRYPVGSTKTAYTSLRDPHWSKVKLFTLNNNEADGSIDFKDQSNFPKQITAVGNAQWDTAQAPTGLTSSALFDATDDKLTIPASTDFDFGTGDFTFEGFVRFNSRPGHTGLFGRTGSWNVYYNAGANSIYFANGATGLVNAGTPSDGVWYHVAVTRSGTNATIWFNGVGASVANSTDFSGGGDVTIGSSSGGGLLLNGWIAAVRVTKGVARYTANFTPPTLPLPSRIVTKANTSQNNQLTSGLVGLWSFDGPDVSDKVYDRSGQGNHGYFYNSATSTAKTIGKIGQALSFDGSSFIKGDTVPTTQTTNVTISAWVFLSSASLSGTFVHNGTSAGSGDGFSLGVGNTTFDNSGNNLIGLRDALAWMNFEIPIGTGWHHVVMTKDSTTFRGYVDGVVSGTTFGGTPNTPSANFSIGRDVDNGPRLFTGKIDDVRIYNRTLSAAEVKQLYNSGR